MKIGQLAATTGVSTKAIRYYEDIGVLPEPAREGNGYRTYEPVTADRIAFIQDAQTAGLTLVEIQMILELRDAGEPTCGHVISTLESHRNEVERQMDDLRRTRARIDEILDQARALNPATCDDPNRCQTIPNSKSSKGNT